MAEILSDEHIPSQLVACLLLLGHDVVTVRHYCDNKAGDGWSDEQVLRFAIERKRAVLTFNTKDFRVLVYQMAWHYGLILAEPTPDFKSQARHIDDQIRSAVDLRGLTIDARLSSLPKKSKISDPPDK